MFITKEHKRKKKKERRKKKEEKNIDQTEFLHPIKGISLQGIKLTKQSPRGDHFSTNCFVPNYHLENPSLME